MLEGEQNLMLVETVHKANFLAAEAAEDLVISVRALWPLVAAAYGIAAFAFFDFFAIALRIPSVCSIPTRKWQKRCNRDRLLSSPGPFA
jgi:hypothetical protein